ncbi:SNF2 family N-terminal domain-containing protein [Hypomontagnella monticulosa]|nr:SNF2 family N-terminal domain-containing protein [Hypomontagnella monticulosa]
MGGTSEETDNIGPRLPASGVKRAYNATNQWIDCNESLTTTFESPSKKICVSSWGNLQESVNLEATNLGIPVIPPPAPTMKFEDMTFVETEASNLPSFPSSYQPVPETLLGFPGQQCFGPLYEAQILTNQYSSDDYRGFDWQGAQAGRDERLPSNLMDDTCVEWPDPNLVQLQAAEYDQSIPWENPPEHVQQPCFPHAPSEATSYINTDNDASMSLDDPDNLLSESQDHFNAGQCNAVSATSFPPSPGITEEGNLTGDERPKESSYDSCFGVINLEDFNLQADFISENEVKYVTFEMNGIMVIVRDADSKQYAGLLGRRASKVIISLAIDRDVELSASIKTPERIEVLIYGWLEQSDDIGNMLLEQDYFLQRPDSHDASCPYYNPQCLSQLDDDDDDDDDPSSEESESSPARVTVLDRKRKNKVDELLDCATGPTSFRRVRISEALTTQLKEHQMKALSMMIEKESGIICDAEFPSVWAENQTLAPSYPKFYNTVTQSFSAQIPRLCLGGLLADEMGLGKTLTTLALIATSLNYNNEGPRATRVTLIVCPMTTITCWQDQIKRHFKEGSLSYKIYHGPTRDDDSAVLEEFDIILTTYETLRVDSPENESARKRSRRAGLLHGINWHRVVLDEAHVVRNRASKTFEAINTLKARHRWCLTGTPIQNRLEDLGALVQFLKVDPFDKPSMFRDTFLASNSNGKPSDWGRLRSLIKAIALRRTKKSLSAELNLPPRREIIQWVDLDDTEKALYDLVKRRFALAIDSEGSVMNTFQFILRLRQICNHGSVLLPPSLQTWLKEASILGNATLPQLRLCELCEIVLDDQGEPSSGVFSCYHQVCRACILGNDTPSDGTYSTCPLCNDDVSSGVERICAASPIRSKLGLTGYRPSSKVRALLQNLKNDRHAAITSGRQPAKSVVFSIWTGMLDLINEALHSESFVCQRLDGKMRLDERRRALEDFRTNPSCTVLLASLGSAAVGLDLTMATRVHLMEPGWNPLLEQQALDRVHRFGQESEVLATRYVVSGPDSIEQYIRQQQAQKLDIVASSFNESKVHREKAETILKDLRCTICS